LFLALVLFLGGAGFLIYLLTMSPGFMGFMATASVLVSCLGAYWLYEDFINAKPNA
jgi:hypothetical protein